MKFLKLEGSDKKTRDFVEKYLDSIDFEKDVMKTFEETIMTGMPFEMTTAHKDFLKKVAKTKTGFKAIAINGELSYAVLPKGDIRIQKK